MTGVTIAQRYARAIFELALETNELEVTTRDVEALAEVYAANPELERILQNPQVEPAEVEAVLATLGQRLGQSRLAQASVRLVAHRRRLSVLPEIAEQLKLLADVHAGVLRAEVTSAVPLSPAYRAELVRELERSTAKKVIAQFSEDPALIAGVMTRIGDKTLDGSLRGRLAAIERQLLPA